jgi:formiminotetrahydrofolate cyclodeaminase
VFFGIFFKVFYDIYLIWCTMLDYDEFYDSTFSSLLELACSSNHIPGGGSVSAMSAALGASMSVMVANLTLNKKGYENVSEEIGNLIDILESGIDEIKKLTHDDMKAFDALLLAYRLPRTIESEKQIRLDEIEKKTIQAAMVPLKISSKANDILSQNKRLSEIGNGSVVNDCAVAAILLEGAVRASMLSVDINYVNIKDTFIKEEIQIRREKILSCSKKTMEETLDIVDKRDKTI